MKMLHRYLEDQNDDLKIRYDERLLVDEVISEDAPLRAKRSKVFLASPRRLLSKTVHKVVAISGSFLPTKVVLRPTTHGDDSPLLHFKSMSADGSSLTTQQSFETGRDSMQEVELSTPSAPGIDVKVNMHDQLRMLKETLERCGRMLKKLSEESLRWSKLTNHADVYFENIACDVETVLGRLELWAMNEDEAQDLLLGDSPSTNALKLTIGALEGILSAAENIKKQMDILGSLASQDSVEKTGCETETVNFLPDEKSVEKIREQMKPSNPLAGQEKVAYKFAEFVLRLHTLSSHIEKEFKCIALHVIFLESITGEVHESRATQDQKGPLLASRQELPRIRSQAHGARADAQESQAEIDQWPPRRQIATARGACTSWYDSHEGYEEDYEKEHEDEDEEDEEEYEQNEEQQAKYEPYDNDSDYDNYDDDDDDARFLEWKRNGYMRTPAVFYSWQERDSIMQHYLDPKHP